MNKVLIYTIKNCPYCEAAKELLKQKNIQFEQIDLTSDEDKRLELVKKTGHKTMPQIFFDEKFIGGYTDLKKHLEENKQS